MLTLPDLDARLSAIAEAIREARRVVFTTHITPDGDGLGSALALARAMRSERRDTRLIVCSSSPKDLRFLCRPGEYRVWNAEKHQELLDRADVIVATDIGGAARLGRMEQPVRDATALKIVLDHHEYQNDLFDLELIDRGASCTAEIATALLDHLDVELDHDLALPLYVGLVTDTGNFSYTATDRASHRLAGRFLAAGVEPHKVWWKLHCQVPLSKMRFLGVLLARLELEQGGRVAVVRVRSTDLSEHGVLPRDAFEVVNHMLLVEGVEVALFLMEIDERQTKVSLRSVGRVDVAALAASYGGGGHRFAAGCVARGSGVDATCEAVLEAIGESFERFDAEELEAQESDDGRA